MARFTIKTRTEGNLDFFMPDQGGYVRLEQGRKHGTLAPQICYGGDFRGSTVTAKPDTFESECRRWWRQRQRWLKKV